MSKNQQQSLKSIMQSAADCKRAAEEKLANLADLLRKDFEVLEAAQHKVFDSNYFVMRIELEKSDSGGYHISLRQRNTPECCFLRFWTHPYDADKIKIKRISVDTVNIEKARGAIVNVIQRSLASSLKDDFVVSQCGDNLLEKIYANLPDSSP